MKIIKADREFRGVKYIADNITEGTETGKEGDFYKRIVTGNRTKYAKCHNF